MTLARRPFTLVGTVALAAALVAAATPVSADVLFEDDFDVDSTANWRVNHGPDFGDYAADFFFDYSAVGIPPAPNSAGTTRGLKMAVNLTSNLFSGFSVSPIGESFEGNFELRFDMWLNFPIPPPESGILASNLTGAGIGTAGIAAQWPGGEHDSVWFGVTGDGGSALDYRAVSPLAQVPYSTASGVYAAGTHSDANNASDPYYASLGGAEPPAAQAALYPQQIGEAGPGAPAFAWRDVRLIKVGDTVAWSIDGLLIATVDMSGLTLGGENILLLHSDINSGSPIDPDAPDLLFGLFDNVRVTRLHTTIDDVLEFFDDAVDDGTLTGSGPGGSAAGRLKAMQNKLEAAMAAIAAGDIAGACVQLTDAYLRTDGAAPPPDFVSGPAAEDLAELLIELMNDLGCP